MNLKLILRTYSALRQLTDDETALLETLRGLTDTERELIIEALSPQTKSTKKSSKKPSKSRRASGLRDAISRGNPTPEQPQRPCAYQQIGGNGSLVDCGALRGNPIHDSTFGYAGYHEFSPASVATIDL